MQSSSVLNRFRVGAFFNSFARNMTYTIPLILFPLYLIENKIELSDIWFGIVNSAYYAAASPFSIYYPTFTINYIPLKNQIFWAGLLPLVSIFLTLFIDANRSGIFLAILMIFIRVFEGLSFALN